MKIFNRFGVTITATAAAFAAISCNNGNGSAAQQQAEGFLNAYLSVDYKKAADFCTEELSLFLNETGKEFVELGDSTKEQIKRQTSAMQTAIESIEQKTADTVIVNYTLADNGETIHNVLSLVEVDGEWKVAALNRL